MKILALEKEKESGVPSRFSELAETEAAKVWDFYQAGVIREIYFRQDRSDAVLVLECADIAEARMKLGELPFVNAGLTDFEIIPLIPYPGYARLFK